MAKDNNDWQVMINDKKSREQDAACGVVTPEVEAAFEVGDRVRDGPYEAQNDAQ